MHLQWISTIKYLIFHFLKHSHIYFILLVHFSTLKLWLLFYPMIEIHILVYKSCFFHQISFTSVWLFVWIAHLSLVSFFGFSIHLFSSLSFNYIQKCSHRHWEIHFSMHWRYSINVCRKPDTVKWTTFASVLPLIHTKINK